MSSNVKNRETVVVHMFAGPGAGKTTCAWEIASKLKKLGYVTEYVSEYAKELVWDGKEHLLEGTVEKQRAVYNEQKRRIDRLIGKVDFVVTDSPPILSKVYLKERDAQFEQEMVDDFHQYHNFCIFVERGAYYEKEGRLQTEEQSKELDLEIKALLKDNGIYFGTYKHNTIDLSIQNMQITFHRINEKRKSSLDEKMKQATNFVAKADATKESNKEICR